jgi:DnaK suppressor protein
MADSTTDSPELDLEAVRTRLRLHRKDLSDRLEVLARRPERGADLNFGKRIGDGTTEAISRLTDVGVGTSLEVSMERIDRAIAKVEEGTYGLCDSCGTPIAPARLAAAPESVLCIACARLGR